jgi:hypothetical protein
VGALPPGPAPNERQQCAMNTCNALVFAKVCKTTNDGIVHINMGPWASLLPRTSWIRVIESHGVCMFAAVLTVTYWLRSMRQCSNATMAVRMFLYCSLVYVKANKEQSFVSMTVALRFTQTKRVRSLPPPLIVTKMSLITPSLRAYRQPTSTAHPTRGQDNYLNELTKVCRAPLLTPSHEAHPRRVATRDCACRAHAEDVQVACVGPSEHTTVILLKGTRSMQTVCCTVPKNT